jgi:hypothetical protein
MNRRLQMGCGEPLHIGLGTRRSHARARTRPSLGEGARSKPERAVQRPDGRKR